MILEPNVVILEPNVVILEPNVAIFEPNVPIFVSRAGGGIGTSAANDERAGPEGPRPS